MTTSLSFHLQGGMHIRSIEQHLAIAESKATPAFLKTRHIQFAREDLEKAVNGWNDGSLPYSDRQIEYLERAIERLETLENQEG